MTTLIPFQGPDYENLLTDLKDRIRQARVKTALAVNRELVVLYWQIGQDILQRQTAQGWGSKVVNRIDRKSTRLNSSHSQQSRMPSSA